MSDAIEVGVVAREIVAANTKSDRKVYLPRHDDAYVVVIMQERNPLVFKGGAGAFWAKSILEEGYDGGWEWFDETPAWIEGILRGLAPTEFGEFSPDEIDAALEFIEEGIDGNQQERSEEFRAHPRG